MARTALFQGANSGSIPGGAAVNMEKHFLIKTLEWASKKTQGFTYNELIKQFDLKEWEVKFLDNHFKAAFDNEGRSSDFRSPLLTETIFYVIKAGAGNFKDDKNTYTLTTGALFNFIDYEELKFARENTKEAKRLSWYAIMLSIFAVIVSILVPILVAYFMVQTIEIIPNQFEKLKNSR